MTDQLELFTSPTPQPTFSNPAGKRLCQRDPLAGPGSCWWWWEGCPKTEQRNCYFIWRRLQQEKV